MKNIKTVKYLLLLLCFTFMISGCEKKKETEELKSPSTPLLIEVAKEDSDNKLYLFGSIHAGDDSLYPLPDYVMDKYKQSTTVAVEFDLIEYEKDLSAQIDLLSNFVNPEAQTITNYIDQNTYEKAIEILESNGLYNSLYDYYNPMFWEMLIENAVILDANLEEKFGIDRFILKNSKEDQKKILELESAEIQYNMLLDVDYDMQVYLLKQAVEEYENSKKELIKLYDLYKAGNKEELEKLLVEEEDINDYEKEYQDKLITERNKNMFTSLEQAFIEGEDIFCTVGLAHIIGEDGLAHLFEQKGYSITIIKK